MSSNAVSDTSCKFFVPFCLAIQKGNIEEFKKLLPKVNPSAWHNLAVQDASLHNRVEMLEILLKDLRVDPSDNENYAFKTAVQVGHIDIVKMLLEQPKVKSTADFEEALTYAMIQKRQSIVDFLKEAKQNQGQ